MVGYDAENRHTLNSGFLCQLCSLILRDPAQLECGHRQCKSCIDAIHGETIKCTICSEESSKAMVRLDKGFRNDMNMILIVCKLCVWEGPLRTYDSHLQTDHPRPSCNFCAKQCESAIQLDQHQLHECEKFTVSCVLKDFGCDEHVIRVQMAEHYLTVKHQSALAEFVRSISFKFVHYHVGDGSRMDVDLNPQINVVNRDSGRQTTIAQLQEFLQMKDILAGGMQALRSDLERLQVTFNQYKDLHGLSKDLAMVQTSIEQQRTIISSFEPTKERALQDVSLLKDKLVELHKISYDGTLLWKIPNIREKLTQINTDQQVFISSPAFFSSPTGYKMQARLYPMGDGNARGTHMSLFFLLMRSEYDPILKFPFQYKVTFCLYDQTPTQRHIIDSFRPDVKSSCFQRPKTDKNIASGIPRFVPLELIKKEGNPYICDNTIYIRVVVDFIDLPKAVVPYAVSLSPSLPASVQLSLIKQEEQKRAQQTYTLSSTPAFDKQQNN